MDYWTVGERGDDLLITCSGHDRERQWPRAIQQFGELMARRTHALRVIVDLRQVSGYETEARRAWQDAFRQHRCRMLGIVCIGGTRSIRMGAAVAGAVSGVPMRFVDDWNEVEQT